MFSVDFSINSSEKMKETGKVFEINDSEAKVKLSDYIRNLDKQWGFSLDDNDALNSYKNDDFLMFSYLLNSFRDIHRNTYFNPKLDAWQNGNSEIPYIHLHFVQRPFLRKKLDGELVVDDKLLNIGVKPARFNGSHIVEFNYYWFAQYMAFLQRIFDDNEELTFYSDSMPKREMEYVEKKELSEMVKQLWRSGLREQAYLLRIYAEGAYDSKRILKPDLCILNIAGKQECVTWGFYNKEKNCFSIPAKKGIYNTSGFAAMFHERNSFIVDLFIESVKFILGHETAHVARGHFLLRKNEPEFSFLRNVLMNCELNADWTAANWMIDDMLFKTQSGLPWDLNLLYNKEQLIQIWTTRIFAIYLALSWVYREDRTWNESVFDEFKRDMKADHPIYHFRLYNVLNKMKRHIEQDYIKKEHSLIIKSADGYTLNEVAKCVWNRANDMILSFESAFRISWDNDERDILQKIKDGSIVQLHSEPDSKEKIPYMLAYSKKAQDELARYEMIWPCIYQKLINYGAFYVS